MIDKLNMETLKSITLLEIGQSLILGDITPTLRDQLSTEEIELITELRNSIGINLIKESKLPNEFEWEKVLKTLRSK